MPPSNPFDVYNAKLKAEGLAPINPQHTEAHKSVARSSADSMQAAAELAAAAHQIMPALPKRTREIWKAFLENNCDADLAAKAAGCSPEKVREVQAHVKHVMLHPSEVEPEEDDDDALELTDEIVTDAPPETSALFEDIEGALEIAAKTAFRVIKGVSDENVIRTSMVKALESSTRVLVLLRKSEAEYIDVRRRQKDADPRNLHKVAGKNKVTP